MGAPLLARSTNAEVSYVRLDPALLAVSCERIKSAVLAELGMGDLWKGKVYISLQPVRADREPIVLTSVRYRDGWSYGLEIPEQVDRARLVKSVVEVLLLEIANRRARELSAELPLWLSEGLAAHLEATSLSGFALEPETRIVRQGRRLQPIDAIRERLRTHAPLTLNELSWPGDDQLSEERLGIYQSCAQVFVSELLRLRDGRACLRDMLARLPESLNWQTSFLRSFGAHFQRLIDVDKWWTLHVVHLTGLGFTSAWGREESCKQLDDILTTPVQVRLNPTELPITTQVTLQNIVREWDFQQQQPVLLQKLNLLQALRWRASRETAGLVDGYRQVLEFYLQQHKGLGSSPSRKGPPPNLNVLLKIATKRLDDLDAQRAALRGQTNAPDAQLTSSP